MVAAEEDEAGEEPRETEAGCGSRALGTSGGRRGWRAEETVAPAGGGGVAATFGRLAEFGVASREIPFTTLGTVLMGEESLGGCGVAPLARPEFPRAAGELRRRW